MAKCKLLMEVQVPVKKEEAQNTSKKVAETTKK